MSETKLLDDRTATLSPTVLEDQRNKNVFAYEIPLLIILALPRSFSSVVSTMLGQHPQMYGLPEMHLFSRETMAEWWEMCERVGWAQRAHGSLRVVAQLCFGEQTEETIKLAHGWLRRRSHFTTGFLFEVLAQKVHPRILVDKSPSTVYLPKFLQRAYRMFPHARFIHLVRHPRGHGESVMKFLQERRKLGPIPPSHWLQLLASHPYLAAKGGGVRADRDIDPQRGWYALHCNICEFLQSVPNAQQRRIHGED